MTLNGHTHTRPPDLAGLYAVRDAEIPVPARAPHFPDLTSLLWSVMTASYTTWLLVYLVTAALARKLELLDCVGLATLTAGAAFLLASVIGAVTGDSTSLDARQFIGGPTVRVRFYARLHGALLLAVVAVTIGRLT